MDIGKTYPAGAYDHRHKVRFDFRGETFEAWISDRIRAQYNGFSVLSVRVATLDRGKFYISPETPCEFICQGSWDSTCPVTILDYRR